MKPARANIGWAGLLALLCCAGTGNAAMEPASWPPAKTSPPQTSQNRAATRLYVLNFTDKDINDVAAEVLGGALGLAFQVDAGVRAQVTLQIEDRLTSDELLQAFDTALRRSGAATVRRNGTVLITTVARARELARLAAPKPVTAVLPRSPTVPPRGQAPAPHFPWSLIGGFGLAGALGGVLVALRYSPAFTRGGLIRKPAASARRKAVVDRLLHDHAISSETLAKAREAEPLRPEMALNRMGELSDDALAHAYASVAGCEVWRPDRQPPLTGQAGAPFDALRRRGMIPVHDEAGTLVVATSDPLDDQAIAEAAIEAGRTVRVLVGRPADVRRAALATPLAVARIA